VSQKDLKVGRPDLTAALGDTGSGGSRIVSQDRKSENQEPPVPEISTPQVSGAEPGNSPPSERLRPPLFEQTFTQISIVLRTGRGQC
jgi:hypothetical protein